MSKKRQKLPDWMHGAVYAAVRSAMAALSIGDLNATLSVVRATAAAYAGASFNRKRVRRAEENLSVAFPDWSAARRREYAIKSYQHLFTLAVEAGVMPRLLNEDGWSRHVRLGGMGAAVQELLARCEPVSGPKRPTVLITGHTGNWELLGYTMAGRGFPMHALFRPVDLAPLDEWRRESRASRGLVLVDKFGATETLPRLMEAGYPVGFVADQNGGDRGQFVPFFGRMASAYKSIGVLALKYQTTILCGQARRLVWEHDGSSAAAGEALAAPDGGDVGFGTWRGEPMRYQLDVVDVIHPEECLAQPDPLFYVTARYRRAIETMVRRAPEQYLWMHRYWKSRPRHEHQGKPMPSAMREKIEGLPWMTQEEMDRILAWTERDAAALREQGARR